MLSKKPSKILIVRFSSIGDIVLCSPVIRCIKKQLGAEIHFITKKKFAHVVTDSPYVDKVLTINQKVSEVKSLLQEEQYDVVVDLHKNIRSQQVRRIAGGRYITFDKINIQKWLAVHTPIDLLPNKHLVNRYMEAIAPLGIVYDGAGLDHFVSDKDIAKAKKEVPGTYAVLSLGATYVTKRLPLEKLISVAEVMTIPIVLIGGPDVEELATALQSAVAKPIINLAGKISLARSSAIVKNAAYVMSGDSGMMHIAAAHRRPLIVPWGSTHPSLGMYPFYPNDQLIPYFPLVLHLSCQPCSKIGKDQCPKKHFECMLGLTDDMIHNAVTTIEHQVI